MRFHCQSLPIYDIYESIETKAIYPSKALIIMATTLPLPGFALYAIAPAIKHKIKNGERFHHSANTDDIIDIIIIISVKNHSFRLYIFTAREEEVRDHTD